MAKAILFDLDGTLADTAPDLNYAINRLRAVRGLAPLPLATTRPVTSMGVQGMLGVGLNIDPHHPAWEATRSEFLSVYGENLCRDTRLFPGMEQVLDKLESIGKPWGVVTNKVERLARPLLEALGVHKRAACIIGGDTTGKMKPDPAPLLAGSKAIGLPAADCMYVGDDRRDVLAARAAGMAIIVCRFGYLNGADPAAWNADAMIDTPLELLDHL